MSDESLRQAQREWMRTGAPEDEGAYLRELRLAGKIDDEALDLAALLGDPAARIALGNDYHPADVCLTQLMRLIYSYGHQPIVRAVLAFAPIALPIWAGFEPESGHKLLYATTEAARRWCVAPTDVNSREANQRYWDAYHVLDVQSDHASSAQESAGELLFSVALLVCAPSVEIAVGIARGCRQFAEDANLREALRHDLVPWLLGRSDPLEQGYVYEGWTPWP